MTIAAEAWRATAPFDRCVALLRYPDNTRTLLSEDGFFVHVNPQAWRHGKEALAAVDAAVPDHLVVPDSTVTTEARGEKITFSAVAPKERTLEIVGEVESRRGAEPTAV